jgi:hypothetical protein
MEVRRYGGDAGQELDAGQAPGRSQMNAGQDVDGRREVGGTWEVDGRA